MTEADLEARFAFAETLVREAGGFALGSFQRLATLTVKVKGAQDLATEADLNTEVLIRQRLCTAFPADGFLGEETGRSEPAEAGGLWVVDPIDGTQPFVSGLSAWCVSIAYVYDGRVEIGAVYAPARDELFLGRRGGAATLNGQPIAVRADAVLTHGIVGVGLSPRVRPDRFLPLFNAFIERGGMFFREGSGALTLCYVACGRLIGYIEPHINSWDCLGAIAVIEAAGGVVNDFLADDGLWNGNRLVAGPPALFNELDALFGPDFPNRADLLKEVPQPDAARDSA